MDPNPTTAPIQQSNSFVPSTWPGAFGLYKYSKAVVSFNLMPVLALMGITFVTNIATDRMENWVSLFATLIQLFAGVALIYVLLSSASNVKLSIGEAVQKSFSLVTLKYVLLTILLALILIASMLLFIVPFFFVLPRVVLALYILVAENAGIMESVNKSWSLTKGHAGKAWGILGVTLLFGLLCVVLIGFYFTIMYAAAFPLLYLYIKQQTGAVPATSAPQAMPQAVQPAAPSPEPLAQPTVAAPTQPTPPTPPQNPTVQ